MWYNDDNLTEKIDFKIKLSIDLTPGIYTFDKESNIGKTRLHNLIKSRESYTNTIASLTFNDVFNKEYVIKNLLEKDECKTIMLDRYDLYNHIDYLDNYKKSKVILIDCKGSSGLKSVLSICKLINEKEKIFVGDN